MRYVIPARSVAALIIPESSSPRFPKAAAVLKRELEQRLDLALHIVPEREWSQGPYALSIHLATLDTLSPEWTRRFEPPLPLLPYPDYADHISLRTVKSELHPEVFVITGSDKALIAGAGALLRHLWFFEDRMEFPGLAADCRPLTPWRGIFFANRTDSNSYFNFTDRQWEELLTSHALWGNNLAGFIPVHFPDWPGTAPWPEPGEFASPESRIMWETHWRTQQAMGNLAAALGLSSAAWISAGTAFPAMIPPELGISCMGILDLTQLEARTLALHLQEALLTYLPQVDKIWFAPGPDPGMTSRGPSCPPGILLDMALRLRETRGNQGRPLEVWLGTEGYPEDELSALFGRLEDPGSTAIRVLVSDPEDPAFAMIKREMPLTGLLLTATPLSSAVRRIQPLISFGPEREAVYAGDAPVILTREWARRYFEAAPLTYGALGISSGCHDEFSRFVWSMLSWSPQPGVDEVREWYGHWFFGAEAAPFVRDATAAMDTAWNLPLSESREKAEEALSCLDQADKHVPPRMRERAGFRTRLLRVRALLDLALWEKSRADKQLADRLREFVSHHSSDTLSSSVFQDILKMIQNFPDASLAARFGELGELRRTLFQSGNLHVQAIDRAWKPSPLRHRLAALIQTALQSPSPDEQRAVWESIRNRLWQGTD
ncbi:MAG: hypothetical protein ACE15F_13255 [bacterium]